MNKKGLFGMALVNVFAIFVLITVLIAFYFLLGMPEVVKKEMLTSLEMDKGNFFLINYLRTPAGVDNKNVADLIADFVDYSEETQKKYVDWKLVYPKAEYPFLGEDPFLNIVREDDSRAESLGIIITKLREDSIFHKEYLKEKISDCGVVRCYLALIVTYDGEDVINYKPLDGAISFDVKTQIPSLDSKIIEVRVMKITTDKSAYEALLAAQSSYARKSTPTSKETLHYDWGAGLDWNALMQSRDYAFSGWKKENLIYILNRLSDKDLMIIVDVYNNEKWFGEIDVDKIENPKEDLRKWFSRIEHEPGKLMKGFGYWDDPRLFRAIAKKYYEDWKEVQENE